MAEELKERAGDAGASAARRSRGQRLFQVDLIAADAKYKKANTTDSILPISSKMSSSVLVVKRDDVVMTLEFSKGSPSIVKFAVGNPMIKVGAMVFYVEGAPESFKIGKSQDLKITSDSFEVGRFGGRACAMQAGKCLASPEQS